MKYFKKNKQLNRLSITNCHIQIHYPPLTPSSFPLAIRHCDANEQIRLQIYNTEHHRENTN